MNKSLMMILGLGALYFLSKKATAATILDSTPVPSIPTPETPTGIITGAFAPTQPRETVTGGSHDTAPYWTPMEAIGATWTDITSGILNPDNLKHLIFPEWHGGEAYYSSPITKVEESLGGLFKITLQSGGTFIQ